MSGVEYGAIAWVFVVGIVLFAGRAWVMSIKSGPIGSMGIPGPPPSGKEKSREGRRCYGAFDLSSSMVAWVLWFPGSSSSGGGEFLVRYWISERALAKQVRKGSEQWEQWVADGHLEMTPGDVVDYNVVTKAMLADCEKFKPVMIGYDPWNAMQTVLTMQDAGWEMIEVRQNYANLSAGSKEMTRMLKGRRLTYGGNPVMQWQLSNLVMNVGANGNIKPDWKESTGPIDGPICLVMGLGLGLSAEMMHSRKAAKTQRPVLRQD